MDEQTAKLQAQAIAGGSKQFQNSRAANISPQHALEVGERVSVSVHGTITDVRPDGYVVCLDSGAETVLRRRDECILLKPAPVA
jgi:hypothetical protein